MGPRGRGGGSGLGEGEEERVRLQAVVIADSFEQRFRPATFTRPKALQVRTPRPRAGWTSSTTTRAA